MSKLLERKDQKKENTWALEDLFPSDEAWEEALKAGENYFPKVRALQGRMAENAQTLLESMVLEDEVKLAIAALADYAQRSLDQDTRVGKYQDMLSRVSDLSLRLNTASSYWENEVLAIPDQDLERFFRQEPRLEVYRLKLDRLRRKRGHVLTQAEETLLAAAGEISGAPGNINSMLNNADMVFPEAVDSQGNRYPVTHGSFLTLESSQDRALRQSAYESLYSVYEGHKNTSAAILAAQAKQLRFFSQARHYRSSLEAALDRTEVPPEVYHNLIDAVHENFPKLHRYVALRKKLLGVEELRFWDIYVPLAGKSSRGFTFPEAKELVRKGLEPLGEEYLAALQKGFEERWIDVYENVGKRSGAYSTGTRVHPYVLLNYQETLKSVFTLAHEMGHAMHTWFSVKHQPAVYASYVIFVAEVASTCNEALLMEHLLKTTTDRKERAYLINHFLEQFRSTIFRQTMFAEFEREISAMAQKGQGLTAEALSKLYGQLNRDYYGPSVVVDDQISLEWARIPHFYYNFYVYQYATGYTAAIALSRRILKEGESAVKDYLNFLSGGSSADPITLLKGAGVDMASPEPIHQAMELFDELITELEELLAE